jgi:hypothetical protein
VVENTKESKKKRQISVVEAKNKNKAKTHPALQLVSLSVAVKKSSIIGSTDEF